MSPRVIAETLEAKQVKLAALTDHNTSMNTKPFALCCKKRNIALLYGMEAQTSEELHVVTLFSKMDVALKFCESWYDMLPPVTNRPEKTGDQVYVDENDTILGEVEKYLIISAPVSLDELEQQVHKLGGLVIPAHVDRPSFSMMSQLGAVVDGNWDALEFVKTDLASQLIPSPYPIITSSDAHYVEHIGRRAFDLDIGDLPLLCEDGTVNLEAVRAGFAKRVVAPAK